MGGTLFWLYWPDWTSFSHFSQLLRRKCLKTVATFYVAEKSSTSAFIQVFENSVDLIPASTIRVNLTRLRTLRSINFQFNPVLVGIVTQPPIIVACEDLRLTLGFKLRIPSSGRWENVCSAKSYGFKMLWATTSQLRSLLWGGIHLPPFPTHTRQLRKLKLLKPFLGPNFHRDFDHWHVFRRNFCGVCVCGVQISLPNFVGKLVGLFSAFSAIFSWISATTTRLETGEVCVSGNVGTRV